MESLRQNFKMEALAMQNQKKRSFTFSIEEIDKLNELLADAEAIMGIFTALNEEDIDPYESGYITRLAYKGLDALKQAYELLNKK